MTSVFSPSHLTVLIYNLNNKITNPLILERRKSLLTSNRIVYIKDIINSGSLELGRKSKLTSQLFQKGFINLNFLEVDNSNYYKFLEGFQLNRKILCIIGILELDQLVDDLDKTYRSFQDFVSTIDTVVSYKCFAFNSGGKFDDKFREEINRWSGLILCEGLKSQEIIENATYSYIGDLLLNCFELATGLITTEHLNIPSTLPVGDEPMSRSNTNSPPLFQYGDKVSNHRKSAFSLNFKEYNFQSKVNELASQVGMISGDAKQKRKTLGRQLKLCSDLYLMTGRFQQAFHLYLKSIEINKGNNDPLWLASSIEGYLCCIIFLQSCDSLESTTSLFNGKSSNKIWGEIVQRYSTEVVDLYGKTDYPLLVVETYLKIAKLTSVLHRFGPNGLAPLQAIANDNLDPLETPLTYLPSISRSLVSDWASLVVNSKFNELEDYYQIHILIQLGSVYGSIGYFRKRSYYYKLASQKFLTTQSPAKFSMEVFSNPTTQIVPYLSAICQGYSLNLEDRGWLSNQLKLYRTLLSICEASNNIKLYKFYLIQNLLQLYNNLNQPDQEVIMLKLQRCANNSIGAEMDIDNFKVPFTCKFVELIGIDDSVGDDKKSPFLYNPYKLKLDKKLDKVQLELDQEYLIKLHVHNPFKLEVSGNLKICIESGSELEINQVEINLLPSNNEFSIPIKLPQVGEYKLKGISLDTILNNNQLLNFNNLDNLLLICNYSKPLIELNKLDIIDGFNLVPFKVNLTYNNIGKSKIKEVKLKNHQFILKEEFKELDLDAMYYRDTLLNLNQIQLNQIDTPNTNESGKVEFDTKLSYMTNSVKLTLEIRDDNDMVINMPLELIFNIRELVSISKFKFYNQSDLEYFELLKSSKLNIESDSSPKGLIKFEFINNNNESVSLKAANESVDLMPNTPTTVYLPFKLIELPLELDSIPILETNSGSQFILKQTTKAKELLLKKLFWTKQLLLEQLGEFLLNLEGVQIPLNMNLQLAEESFEKLLKPSIWLNIDNIQKESTIKYMEISINNHSTNSLLPQLKLNNIKLIGCNPIISKLLLKGEVGKISVKFITSKKEFNINYSLTNLINNELIINNCEYLIN